MRQESRSLGTQPATEPPQSVTGDLTEMWGCGGSPNLPSNLKQHREVYLNKLPFSPGWSALDWPEKWAVAVFSERLPGGGVAPGYLTLRVPFWMAGGEAAQCCGPLLGWPTVVCVPRVRRMGWETAETRLLPPWPPNRVSNGKSDRPVTVAALLGAAIILSS